MKILVADDHIAIRKGVKYILSEEYPNIIFGDAVDTAETIQKLSNEKWDLIILDINLPGRGGLEVLHYLKNEKIKTPVLIFSFYKESQIAIRTLKSGASGYLSKDSADTELIKAMNIVLSGQRYISPLVLEQLVANLQVDDEKPVHENLSNREYEVFIQIASAKTLAHISEHLSLSRPTVSTYRARILKKMGMKTNAELMNYAIRKQLA